MFIDSHAHYDDAAFDKDRDKLIPSLHQAGIDAIVDCASTLESNDKVLGLADKYPYLYAAVGVHPEEINGLTPEDSAAIFDLAYSSDKVVAIGEIGLDYHYKPDTKEDQKDWFLEQIELAKELDLPIIVHSRDAAKDTMDIIKEGEADRVGGVIHAYSGDVQMAKEYVSMGFYLGVGGMVTFANVKKLIRVVEEIDLSHLLLETDCPYLAPAPKRGTRNDSSNLLYVAEKIAQIKGVTIEEVAKVTSENARRLFKWNQE